MSTLIKERSTYYMISGGSSPSASGDFRPYWKIYYDTDAANNRTLITVVYYIQVKANNAGENSNMSYSSTCKINGTSIGTISGSKKMGASTKMYEIGTKTKYISHNSDGSASFTWQGNGTIAGYSKSTASSTYSTANGDFPAIPQGTTVYQTISSKSESAIVVNWSTTDTADYIWYSINGGSSYTAVGSTSATSGSFVISGLSPNTTYTIVTRARRQSSQNDNNYSSSASVTTYNVPTITSISDVTETSFKINWSSSYNTDWAQYSLDNGSSWADLPSYNNISGLTANTTYQVKIRLRHTESQTMYQYGSATVSKQTYDYPKPTSMNNFIIGDGAYVNLYNPLGRNVTLQILQYNTDTVLGTYSGTYNGVVNAEFKTSDAIDRQYRSIPNSSSGTYYCKVTYGNITKTYDDANNHTYYVNSSASKPDINSSYFTCTDTNSTTNTLTGSNTIFVNGYSTLHFVLNTNLSGKNYASISKIFVNSVQYTYSNNFTTDLQNYSSSTVSVYVVDTRGLQSDTVTINLNTKDYFNITKSIDYSYERSNNGVGTEVTFKFKGDFWNKNFGAAANGLTANYSILNQKTNVTTTGTSTITISTNNNAFSFNGVLYGDTQNGFDVDTKYTVTINVADLLSSTQYVIQVIEGTPAIALYGNKISLGAKYDTSLGGDVQLNGTVYINGGVPEAARTIYTGRIYGTESVYLNNVGKRLIVYARANTKSSIVYQIDINTNLSTQTYGSGVVMAWDDNDGFVYYTSESIYHADTGLFTHIRIGYLDVANITYTYRDKNDPNYTVYYIYRIDTVD